MVAQGCGAGNVTHENLGVCTTRHGCRPGLAQTSKVAEGGGNWEMQRQ